MNSIYIRLESCKAFSHLGFMLSKYMYMYVLFIHYVINVLFINMHMYIACDV